MYLPRCTRSAVVLQDALYRDVLPAFRALQRESLFFTEGEGGGKDRSIGDTLHEEVIIHRIGDGNKVLRPLSAFT